MPLRPNPSRLAASALALSLVLSLAGAGCRTPPREPRLTPPTVLRLPALVEPPCPPQGERQDLPDGTTLLTREDFAALTAHLHALQRYALALEGDGAGVKVCAVSTEFFEALRGAVREMHEVCRVLREGEKPAPERQSGPISLFPSPRPPQ